MTQSAKKSTPEKETGTRFVRWFRRLRDKNRRPYRWYEHDCYDA
jgi:hypothetical protein